MKLTLSADWTNPGAWGNSQELKIGGYSALVNDKGDYVSWEVLKIDVDRVPYADDVIAHGTADTVPEAVAEAEDALLADAQKE